MLQFQGGLNHKLTAPSAKASPDTGLGINCQDDFLRNIAQPGTVLPTPVDMPEKISDNAR